jgi:hypothetical protein
MARAAIVLAALVPLAASADPPLRLLAGAAASDDGARTVTLWVDGVREQLGSTSKLVPEGLLLTAGAPCTTRGTIVVESPGTIAAAPLDGTCSEALELAPVRRTTIKTQLTAPPNAKLPPFAVVRAADCGDAGATMDIPVAITGAGIIAGVPSGCKVLSLRVSGFSPVGIPALAESETNRIGPLALKRGAAAALRVSSANGDPLPGVRVAAVRAHQLTTTRETLDAKSLTLAEAITDPSGWARFTELPEEKLFFLLSSEGRSHPQISEPYAFRAGEETVIDDLVLERPANIVVTVSIPKSAAPSLAIDSVELHPDGHNHWPSRAPIRTVITPEGAVVEDVPPGSWRVVAAGRMKSGFSVRTAEKTVHVVPGADQHVTLTVADSIYRGRVARRDKPVHGVINLKPAGDDAKRRGAVAPIDTDGEFEVLLEGPGDYTVSVQDAAGRSVALNRAVAFADPDDEVRIELPDGRIRGRVVAASGVVLEQVTITATQQLTAPAAVTATRGATDGRFELDGVAAGMWEIVAESDTARSEPAVVNLSGGDVQGVTLVMDPVEKVPVLVVDATGVPMRGAVVIAEFPRPDGTGLKRDALRTNAKGIAEFRVSRAQQAAPANLVIMTPDSQVSCDRRRLAGQPSIMVPAASGEVRLTGRRWGSPAESRRWLVSSAGCSVPFLAKSEAEPSGEEAMVFPKLAAGRWTYTETRTPAEVAALLTGRALPSITTFTAVGGTTTRVELPTEQ